MTTVNLILLATLLIVAILEGFNWFTIWAALPLLMAAVLTEFSLASSGGDWTRMPIPKRLGLFGLIGGVVLLTLYMHVTLFFGVGIDDVDESAWRFSYVMAPLYAMAAGGGGFVLGYLYGRRVAPDSSPRSVDSIDKPGPSSGAG